ncbi:hypothetical protein MPDQ_000034 [Monascus purpureus]|uniref:Autophagy-related protein 16 domain-containing protein n=1 Tax=Monascus purpureus TaxID=5098 RepID=A0A507R6J8_MONPU|nr:hypothetical protein MPDQ_000034 [Monascus purpureus]BDD56591.1 hypothetical protein MAP00_002028 [Monascus purpureus]
MVHWREEYFAALAVRDESEKANISLYDAYTRLADRTSRTATTTTPSGPQPDVVAGEKKQRKPSNEPAASITDILTATRADLSEAQRSRSELQGRLDRVTADLGKLQKRSAQDQRRISALESERTNLRLRLRDRDEELRGKAKLLDDFQDELATLNLQLNMAEDRTSRLQQENKELVDRWMARVGKEAEAMNDASKFS